MDTTNSLHQQLLQWVASQSTLLDSWLASLVNINSWSDNKEGGCQVGALLQELFTIQGLTAHVVKGVQYADHLVFRSEGESSPLALIGHLDTVFSPGTFEGYRHDGNIRRGPGVYDMKGGLVVMAFALKAIAEVYGALPPLRVVIVSDEEVGSPEGQNVIREAIQGCSACLVFESGRKGDAIVTQRKGIGIMHATAFGRSAHAGNNHADGRNAIWALSRWIDRVQQLTNYERGVTVCVGKTLGGQAYNIVPDRAEAWIDLRFCKQTDAHQLIQDLHQCAHEVLTSMPDLRIEIDGGIARDPLERSEASVSLMNEYAACAQAVGLAVAEAPLVGGGSDANTASGMGIPAIDGLGPRGANFHTHDEYIEFDSMILKAQALALFLAGRL